MDFKSLVQNKHACLSNSQQKIAKYVVDNLEEVVFDTAYQLAKKVSVSETTIIRFAYALGFSGFSEMSKAMQKSISKSSESMSQDINLPDMLGQLSNPELVEYFQTQIAQGNKAYQYIKFEEFKKICEIIMTKKKILIIGYMDSFGISSELLHVLDKVRSRVYFYRLMYAERDILYDMDQDSLVIAVSLTPHYKYTYEHTVTAKEGGCSVITITDSMISPFTSLSDHSLVFNLKRNSEIDLIDTSPVSSFIFFMINYIYANYKDKIDEYRNSIERRVEKYIE